MLTSEQVIHPMSPKDLRQEVLDVMSDPEHEHHTLILAAVALIHDLPQRNSFESLDVQIKYMQREAYATYAAMKATVSPEEHSEDSTADVADFRAACEAFQNAWRTVL